MHLGSWIHISPHSAQNTRVLPCKWRFEYSSAFHRKHYTQLWMEVVVDARFCAQPTTVTTSRPTKPSPSGDVKSREACFVASDGAFNLPRHSVLPKWYYFWIKAVLLKEFVGKIGSLGFQKQRWLQMALQTLSLNWNVGIQASLKGLQSSLWPVQIGLSCG